MLTLRSSFIAVLLAAFALLGVPPAEAHRPHGSVSLDLQFGDPRPDYVWVNGYWYWGPGGWMWMPGYWDGPYYGRPYYAYGPYYRSHIWVHRDWRDHDEGWHGRGHDEGWHGHGREGWRGHEGHGGWRH